MLKKLGLLAFVLLLVEIGFSQKMYHVIVGSSKNKRTSDFILKRFKDYKDARIILSKRTPPDYRVCLGSYTSKTRAIKLRNRIRKSGRANDVWINVTKREEKPVEHASNSEFLKVFREFAEDVGIPFDVIDDYRNGSLQDLLYNKIEEIPTYLLIVDLKYTEKANKLRFNYYIISQEDLGKPKSIIKTNSQAMGIDIWSRLLEAKEIGEYAYEKLDPNSVREFFWQDVKFMGYRYSFELFK